MESMRRILLNVQAFEKEFARKQMECYSEDKKKELAQKRRELNKAKKRIAEIDSLIQKIYEDNAIGKISDERYVTLSKPWGTFLTEGAPMALFYFHGTYWRLNIPAHTVFLTDKKLFCSSVKILCYFFDAMTSR